MTPEGPRLIQPTTYSPGSAAPVGAEHAAALLRIVAVRWSKGTPGSGSPR